MKLLIAITILVVGISSAPVIDEQLNDAWNLFKQVHQRQYASLEEENQRFVSFRPDFFSST